MPEDEFGFDPSLFSEEVDVFDDARNALDLQLANKKELLNQGKKIAIIRTSDRITYRQCRRKWNWSHSSRGNLQSSSSSAPLWTGTGLHFALEDFHGYRQFKHPRDSLQAYYEACKRANSPIPDEVEDQLHLAKGMCVAEDTWVWNSAGTGICRIQDHPDAVYKGIQETIKIVSNRGHELSVTADHRVLTSEGWKESREISPGDCLIRKDNLEFLSLKDWTDSDYWWMMGYWMGDGSLANFNYRRIDWSTGPDKDYVEERLNKTLIPLGEPARFNQNSRCKPGVGSLYITRQLDLVKRIRDLFCYEGMDYKKRLSLPLDRIENLPAFLQGLFDADGMVDGHAKISMTTKSYELAHDVLIALSAYGIIASIRVAGRDKFTWYNVQISGLASAVAFENHVGFGLPRQAEKLRSLIESRSQPGQPHPLLVEEVVGGSSCKVFDLVNQPDSMFAANAVTVHNCDYYELWLENRDPLKTLIIDGKPQVEVSIYIEIPKEHIAPYTRNQNYLDDIDQILYSMTLDRVIIDPFNRLWLVEYKSAKQYAWMHLDTDPQVNAYSWGMHLNYPNYEIAGCVYQQHKKQTLQPPTFLQSTKMFSTSKRQKTSLALYVGSLRNLYGSDESVWPQANRDFVEFLKTQESDVADGLIRRDFVERNQSQIQNEYHKMLPEIAEMLDPNVHLYPNPTRDCSWQCSFTLPCVGMDSGEDFHHQLQLSTMSRTAPETNWRDFL